MSAFTSSDSTPPSIRARQKWKLISNVFRAVALLRSSEAHIMYNLDDLVEEVRTSPLRETKTMPFHTSLTSQLIEEHKLSLSLFSCIKSSTEAELEMIKQLIESDPRRYVVSQSSPESFINKLHQNTRPLYEADPHLKAGNDMTENCLDVACRWRHQAVVRVLIDECSWSNKEFKKAMKQTSVFVYEMINEKLEKQEKIGCNCGIF
jgi:hypothetical protein